MRTVLTHSAIGACLLGLLGSFVTCDPEDELAGRLFSAVAGAALGFVLGVTHAVFGRGSGGRKR